ncbi:hypothetical protein SELMODRAFT_421839 [Selaginella moellendorffii]|uniref:Uncharacterized protein n=1 Tax=Selaginella moellendorffii TaxID=88036 RepID=D8SGI6_SELML|nr:hypothetical protein SELMODRAFT_421839 [Selaginella moellendorffii]
MITGHIEFAHNQENFSCGHISPSALQYRREVHHGKEVRLLNGAELKAFEPCTRRARRSKMARKIINASDIPSNAMQDENIFKLCNPFVQVKEGDTFIHEDGTHLKAREAVDVRGLVTYDNNQVVGRSIFEMKGNQKWTFGLYQGLNYGVRSLVDNIKRHRFKKFYVVVMGIEWVGCAVIDPIGFLISKEKKLSGIPEFRKQVELKIAYLKQKGKTEEVKNMEKRYPKSLSDKDLLDSLTKEMKGNMSAAAVNASKASRNTEYVPEFKNATNLLVGTATFRKNAFNMNKYPIAEGQALKEELTIVKGIARVIFGDRVLDWKLPALIKHANQRKAKSVDLVKKVKKLNL